MPPIANVFLNQHIMVINQSSLLTLKINWVGPALVWSVGKYGLPVREQAG